jgi:UMF1 family MFS transporter
VLYDWANSAFATTIMAAFFPAFFKGYWSAGDDPNLSTARLGVGIAMASLIAASLAPIMGAMADRGGRRKLFLMLATLLGVLSSAALWIVPHGKWVTALVFYGTGIIGFSGAIVFYDALLPHVAPGGQVDRISSLGYAMGYLGGGLLFALNVLWTLMPQRFGLTDTVEAVRLSFLSVAVWWGGFALWSFAWMPADRSVERMSMRACARLGWRQLLDTLKAIRRYKPAATFLLAYWCYIDGVDTIIKMAVDYGISLGFQFQNLIVALLILQFVAFPAALLFGFLGERWGVRRAIHLALTIYMMVTIFGAMMSRVMEFYILAGVIGLVQGGVQALSRSYFARLIPKEQSAEFFGFYNMLGKFAAILGPLLMGFTGLVVKRMLLPEAPSPEQIHSVGIVATRASIVSVLLLFILGVLILKRVPEPASNALPENNLIKR